MGLERTWGFMPPRPGSAMILRATTGCICPVRRSVTHSARGATSARRVGSGAYAASFPSASLPVGPQSIPRAPCSSNGFTRIKDTEFQSFSEMLDCSTEVLGFAADSTDSLNSRKQDFRSPFNRCGSRRLGAGCQNGSQDRPCPERFNRS
jgi:hypothetical protein